MSDVVLIAHMEARASVYEAASRELTISIGRMTKPGEQVTKRELLGKQRRIDAAVFRLRDAVRAMRSA